MLGFRRSVDIDPDGNRAGRASCPTFDKAAPAGVADRKRQPRAMSHLVEHE
jgi:hypothetical protein